MATGTSADEFAASTKYVETYPGEGLGPLGHALFKSLRMIETAETIGG
jgi:hypothetical protein